MPPLPSWVGRFRNHTHTHTHARARAHNTLPTNRSATAISNGRSTPIVKASPALLLVSLLVAGFLIGGAYPLFFELAAEITYPLDASVSGVAMMVVNNVACLLLLAIFGFVPTVVFNPTMTFTVFICLGLLLFIPARYRRSDADDRAADGAEAGERINGGRAVNAGGDPGGVRDTDRLLAR